MFTALLNINFDLLIRYAVNIGHRVTNTLATSAFFIFATRLNIALINLFFTMWALGYGLLLCSSTLVFFGTIWFINLNPVTQSFVEGAADVAGEYCVTHKWINGAVTNYFSVYKAWRKTRIVLKSLSNQIYNSKRKNKFFQRFFLSRFNWPRMCFFSSIKFSNVSVKEFAAAKLPVVGVVDTDTSYRDTRVVIPGNDESASAVNFFSQFFSSFVLSRKFSNVAIWFMFIRSSKRVIDFNTWLKYWKKRINMYKTMGLLLLFQSNYALHYSYNIQLISSFSSWYHFTYDRLDLFKVGFLPVDLCENLYTKFLRLSFSLITFSVFQSFSKYMKNWGFLKKYFFKPEVFQRLYLRPTGGIKRMNSWNIKGMLASGKGLIREFLMLFHNTNGYFRKSYSSIISHPLKKEIMVPSMLKVNFMPSYFFSIITRFTNRLIVSSSNRISTSSMLKDSRAKRYTRSRYKLNKFLIVKMITWLIMRRFLSFRLEKINYVEGIGNTFNFLPSIINLLGGGNSNINSSVKLFLRDTAVRSYEGLNLYRDVRGKKIQKVGLIRSNISPQLRPEEQSLAYFYISKKGIIKYI